MQGGGAYGSYQAGMLAEYFAQGGQPYDGGYGVSVGGLNAAQLFGTNDGTLATSKQQQAINAHALAVLWETEIANNESVYVPLKTTGLLTEGARKLLGRNLHGDLAVAVLRKADSVYDTRPLRKLLEKRLGGKRWHDPVRVGTVPLVGGRFEELSLAAPPEGMTAVDAIMASAAIPIVFPPIKGYVDGGVTDVTPLREVFAQFRRMREAAPANHAPQELHILRASSFPSPKAGPFDRVVEVLERTLELFVDNTDREDYERAAFVNELAGKFARAAQSHDREVCNAFTELHERYAVIDTYVIGPSKSEMGKFSDSARNFSRDAVKEGIRLGRRRMNHFLNNKDDYLLEVVLFNDDVPKLGR